MGKIIAIASQKGGVGKTTTAVNMGASLAYFGKKVLLVDIDPQGNATSGVGINKQEVHKCIYDVLINDEELAHIIVPSKMDNLFVAPATISLAGAELELVASISREFRLQQALMTVQGQYDFIIIDCPPSLGLLTINALTAANSIIVPVQCEYYALEGLSQLLSSVRLVQKHLNKTLAVDGVLLTMLDARTNLGFQVIEDVKRYFGDSVFQTIIPRNVRLSEAPSHGEPVILYDGRSKGAEAYKEFAEEVMNYG